MPARQRERQGPDREFDRVGQLARDLGADLLVRPLVRLAEIAPEQPVEIEAVLDQDRPVESAVAPDLLPDLGRRLLADDGDGGIPGHGPHQDEDDERDRPEDHGKKQQAPDNVRNHFAQLAA